MALKDNSAVLYDSPNYKHCCESTSIELFWDELIVWKLYCKIKYWFTASPFSGRLFVTVKDWLLYKLQLAFIKACILAIIFSVSYPILPFFMTSFHIIFSHVCVYEALRFGIFSNLVNPWLICIPQSHSLVLYFLGVHWEKVGGRGGCCTLGWGQNALSPCVFYFALWRVTGTFLLSFGYLND